MKSLMISVQRNLNIMGLKLLHELLLENGHESHLLYTIRYDENNAAAMNALRVFIQQLNPDIIGLSLTASEFNNARSLTLAIRHWLPQTLVIWGGVHPSSCPNQCAQYADFLCIGEGDKTMLDIARAIDEKGDIRKINNIAWNEDDKLHQNPLYPLVTDLDAIPFARQLPKNTSIQIHGEIVPLTLAHLRRHRMFRGSVYRTITSRGCPYRCGYCWNSAIFELYPDWRVRRRSVENVIQEIEQAIKDGPTITHITFMDDCLLSADDDYLKDLFTQYKKRVNRPFMAKASPTVVTEEKLRLLVDAGCAWLNIGLQSASQRVCRNVFKRVISPERFLQAANIIAQFPIAPNYDVILDNPFETKEEELLTVKTLTRIPKPYFLQMFTLVFYHQTRIREKALRECPERINDPCSVDFYQHEASALNQMKQIAVTLPTPFMNRLIEAYELNPQSLQTRLLLRAGLVASRHFFQPLTYLRLVYRSQHRSLWKTLRVFPYLLDVRFFSAFNIFQNKSDSTEE